MCECVIYLSLGHSLFCPLLDYLQNLRSEISDRFHIIIIKYYRRQQTCTVCPSELQNCSHTTYHHCVQQTAMDSVNCQQ